MRILRVFGHLRLGNPYWGVCTPGFDSQRAQHSVASRVLNRPASLH
jgi:hypothetical protein